MLSTVPVHRSNLTEPSDVSRKRVLRVIRDVSKRVHIDVGVPVENSSKGTYRCTSFPSRRVVRCSNRGGHVAVQTGTLPILFYLLKEPSCENRKSQMTKLPRVGNLPLCSRKGRTRNARWSTCVCLLVYDKHVRNTMRHQL